jgi:hypothetical protein
MKNYTYNSYKKFTLIPCFVISALIIQAQETKTSINRFGGGDSIVDKLNMDAVYDRPFLTVGDAPVALGGYLEANSIYNGTDGVNEGLSFQARRLTMFMSASISKRIKFLSEMEFEDGTKEIGIEFAAIDVSLHPALNLRGGIIMNPIGGFNQNHDGPKWEFVDRPEVAVNMLPATWSNAGFGAFGKFYKKGWIFGYEFYLTNGFDNTIIDNEKNKTFLPSSKANEERFEESNSGEPLITGKLAIKNRKYGEVGFSYMGGVYNKYFSDGIDLDVKRRVDVFTIDINTTINKTGTRFIGEYTTILVDVPKAYGQQYGNKQQGAYLDVIQPILKRKVLDWNEAILNLAIRLDYVDWNVGNFNETNTNIGDERFAITPAVSFRPTGQTVFRLNYKFQTDVDILNNAPAKTAAWMFGFSTYF